MFQNFSDIILNTSILIVYMPLLNFLSLLLFSRYFGKKGSIVLTVIFLSIMLILTFFFFFKFISTEILVVQFNFGSWIFSYFNIADWSFTFDSFSIVMSVVVCSVSFLVHIYSFDYMSGDPKFNKFLSYLSLFTFFMLILIFSDNLIVFFLGWEGVGLCSYLLVGFWTTRVQAGKSALKAIFMNRIGDFFLIIATCLLLKYFKTTNISTVLAAASYFNNPAVIYDSFFFKLNVIDLVSIFLLLGAVGKSAQIGLHTWLPDAMEGPTPVSALIHAATMVTAGIFLIIRLSYLVDFSQKTLFLMILFGTLTSFFSGLIAMCQWDLKKIVAFSTCSQLGYMLVMCGLSAYALSFYHLLTHAFFKALLFLSSGYVIHLFTGEQDIRKMGSLIHKSPFSYVLILVASLSLMGFPFLSGFYSKEFILHSFFLKSSYSWFFWIFYFFIVLSAVLTAVYSVRLVYYTYFLDSNFLYKKNFFYTSDSVSDSKWIIGAMLILGFFSVFVGYFVKNLFLPGSNFFNSSIFYSFKDVSLYSEFIFFSYDTFILFFTIFLFFLSIYFSSKIKFIFDLFSFEALIFRFFNFKLYFDVVYNYFIGRVHKLIFFFFEILEKGIFELIGPNGLTSSVYYLARATIRFHSGFIHHYANIMLLGILIMLCSLLF